MKSRRTPGRSVRRRKGASELKQLLSTGNVRGGFGYRRRDVEGREESSRGRASGGQVTWRARW
jgi:hypothetical protein